jgi:hypothetical protein
MGGSDVAKWFKTIVLLNIYKHGYRKISFAVRHAPEYGWNKSVGL